jgi:hypothetical protein
MSGNRIVYMLMARSIVPSSLIGQELFKHPNESIPTTGLPFDQSDTKIITDAVKEVREVLDRHEKYPDIDLFKEFR